MSNFIHECLADIDKLRKDRENKVQYTEDVSTINMESLFLNKHKITLVISSFSRINTI